jgi:hypothetical protein
MDRSVCSCSCSRKHLGFGFSGLDPEDLTSNRGSWLLGRKRLWKANVQANPRVSQVVLDGKVQREMREAARDSA